MIGLVGGLGKDRDPLVLLLVSLASLAIVAVLAAAFGRLVD